MKAHSGKSVNLSDMTVSNEDGYLSRSKTFNSNNKIVKERIWITVKLTIQKLCSEDATLTSELLRLNTACLNLFKEFKSTRANIQEV